MNNSRDLLDWVAAQMPALEARVAQTHATVERHRDAGAPEGDAEPCRARRERVPG